MFAYFFRSISRIIPHKSSIYEKSPDIKPLITNEAFTLTPVKANRKCRRSSVLGLKQGMTAMWDKWGVRHALTVLLIDRCQVVQVKKHINQYFLQLGVGERAIEQVTKPLVGHYIKADVPPKKGLVECKVSENCVLPVGYELKAAHFQVGQFVDVRSLSKGKGFQGGIKRWNFNRQPATHGNSVTTRCIGSTGNRQDPGRTFPGKKMPGRLGGESATIFKQKIYKIDHRRNLLFIKGAVPGGWGAVVRISDSIKDIKKQYRNLPHPTCLDMAERPEIEVMAAAELDTFETEYLHDNDYPEVEDDEAEI